jgi:hypothetical protein
MLDTDHPTATATYINFCILVPLTIQFFSISSRSLLSRVLDHPCFRRIIARGLAAETTPDLSHRRQWARVCPPSADSSPR